MNNIYNRVKILCRIKYLIQIDELDYVGNKVRQVDSEHLLIYTHVNKRKDLLQKINEIIPMYFHNLNVIEVQCYLTTNHLDPLLTLKYDEHNFFKDPTW